MTEAPWLADWPALFEASRVELVLTEAVMRELDALAKNYARPQRVQERARQRRDALVAHLAGDTRLQTRTGVSVSDLVPSEGTGDDALVTLLRNQRELSLATDDGLLALRIRAWGGDARLVPAAWLTTLEGREWQPRVSALESSVAELRERIMPEPVLSLAMSDGSAVVPHAWKRVLMATPDEIQRHANERTGEWMDKQSQQAKRTRAELRDLMARRQAFLDRETELATQRARNSVIDATRLAIMPMLLNTGAGKATNVRVELVVPAGAHQMRFDSFDEDRRIENGTQACVAVVPTINAGDELPLAQVQTYWSREEARDELLPFRITAHQLRAPVTGSLTIQLRPT